jgi:hypothetical protein
VHWRLEGHPNPEPKRIVPDPQVPTLDVDAAVMTTAPYGPVAVGAVSSLAGLTGNVDAATLVAALAASLRTTIDPNLLDVGESTIPRHLMTGSQATAVSGQIKIAYVTAQKSEQVAQVRTVCGTAAGATPTLCRIGVYGVAANGNLALLGATANDVTMWAAANTQYTRSLAAPFAKVAGQRYAVATMIVTAGTLPTWPATTFQSATEWAVAPRISGVLSGQTDLPASVAAGSVGNSAQIPYTVLLP